MKRVNFEIAKALKEAGYPQGDKHAGDCYVYPLENHDCNFSPYTRIGKLSTRYKCNTFRVCSEIPYVVAPYYMETWLWLWREKGIRLNTNTDRKDIVCIYWDDTIIHRIKDMKLTDPEEAIIAAIEYLCDNNLIK